MQPIPSDLRAAIPEKAWQVAERWWDSLAEGERLHISTLWDERLEVCFFSPQADATGILDDWSDVPAVRGGRFVPSDDNGSSEWSASYFEHLLQHPELVLAYEPPPRRFHIGCAQHSAARSCITLGQVPADFVCPVASLVCPLMALRGARLTKLNTVQEAARAAEPT